MSTTALTEAPETKSRTRRPARATARPAVQKTKVTLVLDDDAAQRLAIHAVMSKMDRSELVNMLVREHLRKFVVSDRSRASCDTVPIGQTDAA